MPGSARTMKQELNNMKINVRMLLAATLSAAGLAISSILPAVAANVHDLPPNEVFTEVNPCTGALAIITEVYTNAVFHLSVDASGGTHVTGTANGTISTNDGFAGRFTDWFGGKAGGGSGVDQDHFTFSATLRNGAGQVANVHASGHFIMKDGVPVKTTDNFSAVCVGKPSP